MKNPFLVGKNIYLKGLEESDLDGNYVQWLNDPEVCKYNSHHVFPYNKALGKEYISVAQHSRNSLILAIILKNNDKHIGNISLQNIDTISRCAEFAILIGEKEEWGKGYSKEASLLIMNHGFNVLNLNRVYCGTAEDNIGMQKLAAFMGMQQEGCRRNAQFKNGNFINIIEYGVLRSEFFNTFNINKEDHEK